MGVVAYDDVMQEAGLEASARPLVSTEGAGPRPEFSSVQFRSVAQSCPTLCDPLDYSPPGLPVHQQLPEFTQAHVH